MCIFSFIDNYNLLSQEVPPVEAHVRSVYVCVCVEDGGSLLHQIHCKHLILSDFLSFANLVG